MSWFFFCHSHLLKEPNPGTNWGTCSPIIRGNSPFPGNFSGIPREYATKYMSIWQTWVSTKESLHIFNFTFTCASTATTIVGYWLYIILTNTWIGHVSVSMLFSQFSKAFWLPQNTPNTCFLANNCHLYSISHSLWLV